MKKDLVKQLEETTYRWKRALADYQNLERRYEKEKSEFVDFANSNLIIKLITVLDHLDLAQKIIKDKGLDVAIKGFRRVLEEEGLSKIKTLGEDFDPNLMEAVELVKGAKDKVVEVIVDGYTLKDKLLRPAKVKVGRG